MDWRAAMLIFTGSLIVGTVLGVIRIRIRKKSASSPRWSASKVEPSNKRKNTGHEPVLFIRQAN